MIITCEECKTSYNLNASLLQPSGTKVRCTNCRHVFTAFPAPEEVPEMVKAEPVAEMQMDTPLPQSYDEPERPDTDDLFGLDEEDSFEDDTAWDSDDFDLAGEDFNLPGNDMEAFEGGESFEGAEPSEADLQLTDEDLDLVMNMAPPGAKAAAEASGPSTNSDTALADRPEAPVDVDLLEDMPAEDDAGPEPAPTSESDLDLDLDLDFGEDVEATVPDAPSAPSAPELEGADELDLDLDLDLDLGEEETATDSEAASETSELSLDEAFEESLSESLSEELDLDENLDLDEGQTTGASAESVAADEVDAKGSTTDDDLGFEDLDLDLDLEEEGPTNAGSDTELALELENDESDGADVTADADDDLDLDLDFDLDDTASEAPSLEGDEGTDPVLELDLEEDADSSNDQDGDDGLALELGELDLASDDSPADAAAPDEELAFDLNEDFELSLEDDTETAGAAEEDDLDLADLEGILDEDGADKTQAAPEESDLKEEGLLGDEDLGLANELEGILDEDDSDSDAAFSLEEEPELDLDLENPQAASSDDDDLDLSDFEYLAEDGEKAPSDTHFDSGDMELEFEVDEESASALEEADAQFTPPSEPKEKPAEPQIVPTPAAGVKAPAGPAPVPKKRGTSKLLIVVLILVLLLGGGYCAYILLDGMGIRIPYVSDYLKPEANDPGNLQMTTFDINSRFVDSQTLGRIFVITGKVKNGYDHPRGFVQLTGKLFTKGKKLSSNQTVYAGNLINDMDLVNLNAEELTKRLNNRFGNNRINSRVQPGKALPFMVVFTELPEEQLEEFTIEVDASTALK
jgi:pilus assembly protein FimV